VVFNYVVGLYDSCKVENKDLQSYITYADTIINRQMDMIDNLQGERTVYKQLISSYQTDSVTYGNEIFALKKEVKLEHRKGTSKTWTAGATGASFGALIGAIGTFFGLKK